MKDLIAKLEAASEDSRELDILVAVAVGHHEIRMSECGDMSELWDVSREREYLVGSEYQWHKFDGPFYTTSIDAALTLVPEGWITLHASQNSESKTWFWGLHKQAEVGVNGGFCQQTHSEEPFTTESNHITVAAPLAICIAALKARNEK